MDFGANNFFRKAASAYGAYVSGAITGGTYNTLGSGYAQGGDATTAYGQGDKTGRGGGGYAAPAKQALGIKPPPPPKKTTVQQDIETGLKEGVKTTQTGASDLNRILDTDSSQGVQFQANQEKAGVLSAAQDARRNAQRSMAQQGLKGSSLGLSSQRSIDQDAGNRIASINAATPMAIRNQQIKDAQTRMSAGTGLFNTMGGRGSVQAPQQESTMMQNVAALAPIAGTVIGGIYGGPAGAAAGGAVGGAINNQYGKKPDAAGGTTQYSSDYLSR